MLKSLVHSWRDAMSFMKAPPDQRRLVVYSEGAGYGPFLEPVVEKLAETWPGRVAYLTSDPQDPLYVSPPDHVSSWYVGKGSARTFALNNMVAGVLAMTMPDLDTFHIKRAPGVGHYAYIHHSMVSTHMIYRTGAFDRFDSVLCVGPHHIAETRAWEKAKGLPEKQLFEHGYAPLDSLMARAADRPPPSAEAGLNVLVAPSWGPRGLLEAGAGELISGLLDAGHDVHVRPHPRTRQLTPRALDELNRRFGAAPGFHMGEKTQVFNALFEAHVMISDWSGVAMEFAFGLERPVLFVDVPRKVNNPDYGDIAIAPLEAVYRERVGAVLAPTDLGSAVQSVAALHAEAGRFVPRIRVLREETIFNVGSSAQKGAEILAGLAAKAQLQA